MKTIGFIDYYLDEWHANKYPEWIAQATNGEMQVKYAYALRDSENGLTSQAWCAQKGVELLGSIEEVVEKSDYIIVLSPDNSEYHEQLATPVLRAGKPTYVDKTFTPDRATAKRLVDLAKAHGTPLYSSSALRFASEYRAADRASIDAITAFGPGSFTTYAVHQVEPIISLMGYDATRIMYTGTEKSPSWTIAFRDGRQAMINHYGGIAFTLAVNYNNGKSAVLRAESDFFGALIQDMVQFFRTGEPTVDANETIMIMTILEYGDKARQTPYEWVELPPVSQP